MDDFLETENEDPFLESDEWIAAMGRQLFRAVGADDSKAVEVCVFYLQGYLVLTLSRHLRNDPRWNTNERWLDGLGAATPDVELPVRLTLRDDLTWATRDQKHWYTDPFEFELVLCAQTGAFRSYTFRFGDNRSLSEKEEPSSSDSPVVFPDADGWAFVFHRQRE
jgi:hypothetical protein